MFQEKHGENIGWGLEAAGVSIDLFCCVPYSVSALVSTS